MRSAVLRTKSHWQTREMPSRPYRTELLPGQERQQGGGHCGRDMVGSTTISKHAAFTLGYLHTCSTVIQPSNGAERRHRSNAIVIGESDTSYTDILIQVKKEVTVTKQEVNIWNVRKTRKAEVVLELGKSENPKNLAFEDSSDHAMMWIRGIDLVTTTEELEEAI